MTAAIATEAWRWGDLFELDLPLDAETRELGEMLEIRLAEEPATPLWLAVFSPIPEADAPLRAIDDALRRFAAARGFTQPIDPSLNVDAAGVASGRLAFVTDAAWEVLALAWNRHLVVAFSSAPSRDAGIFDRAEALLASLRPGEVVVASAAGPEPAGDF